MSSHDVSLTRLFAEAIAASASVDAREGAAIELEGRAMEPGFGFWTKALQVIPRLVATEPERELDQLAALLHRLAQRITVGHVPFAPSHSESDGLRTLAENCTHAKIKEALFLILAQSPDAYSLRQFAAGLAQSPPQAARSVGLIVGTLIQRKQAPLEALFPEILAGLQHPQLAAPVLDLANFLTREGRVDEHPAAERRQQLADLLRDVTQNLLKLEAAPGEHRSNQELQEIVVESVAIAVALCDALAQIGDPQFSGRVRQALQLRHRRLQTEAAAALVRLGEDEGREALIALASEPIVRLRVLAYAEELGIADEIDEQFATPAARAEAELALWLAQPEHMGFPPSAMELVDERTQYWPGHDEPEECFLFRFTYPLNDFEFSNLALVGPVTHGFRARLVDLPLDDVYAIFAGWYAEHEELFEVELDSRNPAHQGDLARASRRCQDEGLDHVEPLRWGVFFGERVLIATADKDKRSGFALVDSNDVLWVPRATGESAIGDVEAYNLYKGRKLLRSFNE